MNNEENNIDLPKKKEEFNNNQENSTINGVPQMLNNNNIINDNVTAKEEPVLENVTTQETFNPNPLPVQNINDELLPVQNINNEPLPVQNINNEPLPVQNIINNQSDLVTPTLETIPEPVTPIHLQPQNDTNNLITPTPEPMASQNDNIEQASAEQGVKLEKKLIVEKAVKKTKKEGNSVVGFFALLIILGIIIAAFYYFVSQDIIKLPDNINLPFTKATTTTITTTTAPAQEEQEETVVPISISGLYEELAFNVCPEVPLTLTLLEDKTFTYNNLTFNETDNQCTNNDINGTYVESENIITLSQENGDDIVINILTEENKKVLSIPINDTFIKLHKVS